MSTSKPRSRPMADVQTAMDEVLAAERAAVDAIAASQRRADELVQAARARARRIGERTRARVAALERAHPADLMDGPGSQPSGQSTATEIVLSDQSRARLQVALAQLADGLLGSDDVGS